MRVLTKMILAKMKLMKLIELQLKIFSKRGNCKAFQLIDSEISRRVANAYTL